MEHQIKNLILLYKTLQPEQLFHNIENNCTFQPCSPKISVSGMDGELFYQLAGEQYPNQSYEEILHIHRLMQDSMQWMASKAMVNESVFLLLVQMGQNIFREMDYHLVCQFSKVLPWQSVYQRLGQDLFTTSYYAFQDVNQARGHRREFLWSPILQTDNTRLHTMLRQGLAENHCHLGGTTQNFALSWACIMNIPEKISVIEKTLSKNLHATYSRGISYNVWSWKRRLQWACYLRLELFKLLERENSPSDSIQNMEESFLDPQLYLKTEVQTLKCNYGAVVQCKSGWGVLDYALRNIDCSDGLLESHTRLLSGERSFLYRCFRACFDGKFDITTQNWFYLYLLIKENFRAELIQSNHQTGFHNFQNYQDRKDTLYDKIPIYQSEAIRLAVHANQIQQNITQFELRIAPKDKPKDLCCQIKQYEDEIIQIGCPRTNQKHFYVYHFIKSPDLNPDYNYPRNYVRRVDSEKKAMALGYALQHSAFFCKHIWGIDTANTEIGCRPEVYAVIYRYLKNLKPNLHQHGILDCSTYPHIHATYHAGEDFLDLVDGMRAIDEAIHFLHLERGDRIGHALALGVEPSGHYKYKSHRVVLPKQDLLDNIIWLLYRSEELGVEIPPQLRANLQSTAEFYLTELYKNTERSSYDSQIRSFTTMEFCPQTSYFVAETANLYDYYCAMKLRGDDPMRYREDTPSRGLPFYRNEYDQYREDPNPEFEHFRRNPITRRLYQRYHFDKVVRKRGESTVEYTITNEYIHVVRQMQDALQRLIAQRGIMVECNPTSNYLIGSFQRYDEHPMIRFNNAKLISVNETSISSHQVSISINTDDLGIFDTSLENEYTIMAAALEYSGCYTYESIYDYLDYVRNMGLAQSFLSTTISNEEPQ